MKLVGEEYFFIGAIAVIVKSLKNMKVFFAQREKGSLWIRKSEVKRNENELEHLNTFSEDCCDWLRNYRWEEFNSTKITQTIVCIKQERDKRNFNGSDLIIFSTDEISASLNFLFNWWWSVESVFNWCHQLNEKQNKRVLFQTSVETISLVHQLKYYRFLSRIIINLILIN